GEHPRPKRKPSRLPESGQADADARKRASDDQGGLPAALFVGGQVSETVKPVVRRFTGGAFGQNSYLVSCPGTNEGILVDPGASVGQMLAAAETEGIRIVGIVLTHAHIDHVEGVPEAKRATGAPVYLHPADSPLY